MDSMRSNVFVFVQIGLFELTGFSETYFQSVDDAGFNLHKVLFDDRVNFDHFDRVHRIGYDESIDLGLEQCELLNVRGFEKKFLNLSGKSDSVANCFENLNVAIRAAHGEGIHVLLVDVESDEAILINIFHENFPKVKDM